jgi:hypothetical protein
MGSPLASLAPDHEAIAEYLRALVWSVLVPQLPPDLQQDALTDALAAAYAIGYESSRASALSALAPHMSLEPQRDVAAEALATARAIGDESSRAEVLIALVPHLPPELRPNALEAARDSGDRIFARGGAERAGAAPNARPAVRGDLLAQAVRVKVLSDQQALNLIALQVSDEGRAKSLVAIAGTAPARSTRLRAKRRRWRVPRQAIVEGALWS